MYPGLGTPALLLYCCYEFNVIYGESPHPALDIMGELPLTPDRLQYFDWTRLQDFHFIVPTEFVRNCRHVQYLSGQFWKRFLGWLSTRHLGKITAEREETEFSNRRCCIGCWQRHAENASTTGKSNWGLSRVPTNMASSNRSGEREGARGQRTYSTV